jgi:hypothetical protein
MSEDPGQGNTHSSEEAAPADAARPAGVRHSKAYNLVLGVVILLLGLFVLWNLSSTFGSVDGPKLAELTRKRAELKVGEYLAGKKIKHVAQDGTVGGDMTFTVGEFTFITPVDGLKTLPEVVSFELTLPSQGHPENKSGKVHGEFNKNAGEMHLVIDMLSYRDSLTTSFVGSKVE